MDSGWIKLWRKSIHSTVWQDPYLWKLWTWCLMRASHKENTVMFGFSQITLERGQFISGRRSLSETMNKGIKNNRRLSTSSWERRLKLLQNMDMLNLKVNHQYTVISVINYDTYQSMPEQSEPLNEPRVNHERTTSEPPVNTNKNVKTVKNAENFEVTQIKRYRVHNLISENSSVLKDSPLAEIVYFWTVIQEQ